LWMFGLGVAGLCFCLLDNTVVVLHSLPCKTAAYEKRPFRPLQRFLTKTRLSC
jgi:hypothetical protein